jgi:ribosomal protein S18 acetylase RimI-like enzyme
MTIETTLLGPGDEAVLAHVAADVFDHAIDLPRTAEFLADSRHHIAVAIADGVVVGFVSAVHYVHPDKPQPELWINEVSVAPAHRQRGLAKTLLQLVIEAGRRLGCGEAWVLTDRQNPAAMRLYASAGGVEATPDAVMFTFSPHSAKAASESGSTEARSRERNLAEKNVMTELPPLMRDQRKADLDHLRLLAIFHFIVAALSIVGLGLLFLHYSFMHSIMANPEVWKNQKNGAPPPEQIMEIFKWFCLFFGAVLIASGVANLLSGWFIQKKRHRLFSLIIAGLNCLHFPFGTVLGVFTFAVLLRDSVRELYEAGS